MPTRRKSTAAKARTPVKAKAAARRAITDAKARIPVKGRAAAQPTAPRRSNDSRPGSSPTRLDPHQTVMPANRFNGFQDYRIGIGLRIPHYEHIFEKKPVVDWFEIIFENSMGDGGRPLRNRDRIPGRYPRVQPGV